MRACAASTNHMHVNEFLFSVGGASKQFAACTFTPRRRFMRTLWRVSSLRSSRTFTFVCLFILTLYVFLDLPVRLSIGRVGHVFDVQQSQTKSTGSATTSNVLFPSISALAAPTNNVDHQKAVVEGATMSTSYSLASELARKRKIVMDQLSKPAGDGVAPLILIMGNEAGDTDSLASSILLCHLLSTTTTQQQQQGKYGRLFDKSTTFVPLVQQHRSDLPLRAENQLLLSLLDLSPDDLLFLDDLPSMTELKQRKDIQYGLTDHPRLSSSWQPYDVFEKQVVIVVDHHADDGAHRDAKVRVLKGPENGAVASDVSVVVEMFKDEREMAELPAPLATLALAAVLIDTDDLRPMPNGKATNVDLEAAKLLLQRSSLTASSTSDAVGWAQKAIQLANVTLDETDTVRTDDDDDDVRQAASQFFRVLSTKKLDVSRLTTRDLLRRDYKENMATLADEQTIRAGFSSVPVGLSDWVHTRHGDGDERWSAYWRALHAWMGERSLDVAVVGTSFRELAEHGSLLEREKNGKHRRELVLAYVRRPRTEADNLFAKLVHSLQMDEYAASLVESDAQQQQQQRLLLNAPWKGSRRVASTGKRERVQGVEQDGRCTALGQSSSSSSTDEVWIAVWRQFNARASRKVYLPAVMHALKIASRSKAGGGGV